MMLSRPMSGPARMRPLIWIFTAAMAVAAPCWSASLQVAPTSFALRSEQGSDGLWLSNSGDEEIQAQVRVYRWTQKDGADVLEPTRELILSPAIQRIAPGQRQLVRVIRSNPAAPTHELSYRLVVDELPGPQPGKGLKLVLRYSIPVFVAPATSLATSPKLLATLRSTDDNQALIEVRNDGAIHAQIAALNFKGDDAIQAALIPGLVGYVLAGQTMRWSLPGPTARFHDGVFMASINGEATERPLPLATVAH